MGHAFFLTRVRPSATLPSHKTLSISSNPPSFSKERSITTDNLELIAHLAGAGIGVAILPSNVAKMQDHGNLRKMEHLPTYQDELCLIYRQDMNKTQAVKMLIASFTSSL